MWDYGHNLDPKAPVTVEPFMPVIIGSQQIANFQQSSLPQMGTYLLAIYALCLMGAIWFSRKETI